MEAAIPEGAAVWCRVMVTRWAVRSYWIRFKTFREAADRLRGVEDRHRAFRWLETRRAGR